MVGEDLDQSVRDLCAVAQMQVVEVLANRFDGTCTSVRDLVAFGQGEIPQSGCCREDPEQGIVCKIHTRRQVQYAESLELMCRRQDHFKSSVRKCAHLRQVDIPDLRR